MSLSDVPPLSILVLASEYKGVPFIEECKRQGCRVMLLVGSNYADAPWPWHDIDEHWRMPDITKKPDVIYAVSYLARERAIDRIVPLDDYDVETAASLREHMRLPGMTESGARFFRDKLAMRVAARAAGLPVPDFTGFFNHTELRAFMARIPPPWVFKPRSLAGSDGVRLMHSEQEVWDNLTRLKDRQSFHLMEHFIAGDVYHVDALTWRGEVIFALVSKYGRPPMVTLQSRGVFTTRVLPPDDEDATALRELNRRVITTMGRRYGVTHTEFIRSAETGEWYFLETSARVGGGNIDKLVEAASGLELWQEAARMELSDARGEDYRLPPVRDHYAGLIACPAKPGADLTAYSDPELTFRAAFGEFVFLIVGSADRARIDELMNCYVERVIKDFLPQPS